MSDATPVQGWSERLLDLPQFVLTNARIDEHDELVADVQLSRDVRPCLSCGVIDLHLLQDWRTHMSDLPVAGRACGLRWRKRVLACTQGCGTFTVRTPAVALGEVCSRAAARAAVAASAENIPIDRIGREFESGRNTVMRAVLAAAAQLDPVTRPRIVTVLIVS